MLLKINGNLHGLFSFSVGQLHTHVGIKSEAVVSEPQLKGAPTKEATNFCMREKWAIPEWNESDEQKKVARFWGESTADTRTVMTKRSPGKIGSAAPVEGPHIFFLNRVLLWVNPALMVSAHDARAPKHPRSLRLWRDEYLHESKVR